MKQAILKVNEIYNWIDAEIKNFSGKTGLCTSCGKCCDFESFGHRLFITSPEIIYFAQKIQEQNFKKMTGGVCPYRTDGICSVHDNRFAGCRIFFCKLDENFQQQLSEQAIKKLKDVCTQFDIPYAYKDLKASLDDLENHSLSIG